MKSRIPFSSRSALVILAALSSAAWGCGSGTSESTGSVRTSLHRAQSCGDLLADLKADAAFKINKAIDQQIAQTQRCIAQYGETNCAYGGGYAVGVAEDANSGGGMGTSAPTPPKSGGDLGGGSDSPTVPGSAGSHSETNTQVAGVDEADIVKTDGKNLYLIHGRAFKVLRAWPADQLAEVSSLDLEGQPTEMFVADGKVVVYSTVNGSKIFAAAGVTPRSTYQEYYGGGAKTDVAVPRDASGEAYAPLTKITVLTLDGDVASVSREVYFEGSYLDSRRVASHVRTVLSDYAHGPQLKYGIWELYPTPANSGGANGAEPSTPPATDVGTRDFGPQNPYPTTGSEYIQALEQLRNANLSIINATTEADWLPYTFVKNGAAITAERVACADFYVPTAGSTVSGITEVATIDLANPTAMPKQTAILGQVTTVYGSTDTLYLAANAWVEPPALWYGGSSGGGTVGTGGGVAEPATPPPDPTPAPTVDAGAAESKSIKPLTTPTQGSSSIVAWSTTKTHVHKFEFTTDPTFPNYVASGTVAGSVKDQFSLDDKDGKLRIATTEDRIYGTTDGQYVGPDASRPNSVNHLFVLGENAGWLDSVGDVGDLAPGERIYSARFVGNRGYIVTFRQVDPLFVVDLTQPSQPTVLAALKIPGFSEYMHPLDENHLLTIGREADANGRQQGLALQIFDVTNGAAPVQQFKTTYSSTEYGSSEAEYDHKAFTYFADKNLLAFPYYTYDYSTPTGMRSSLELFRVDLASGFQKLGSIDHTALVSQNPTGYCGGYYGPQVRRGVFLENFVYSISYGGVVVKNANDLAAPGSELALPAPTSDPVYGYGAPVCAY